MATAYACATLVDVFPDVVRLKRTLTSASSVQSSTALVAVAALGHPRVSELAEHLHLDLSTVSRQVTQLRQRGLVRTCPDPADGRSQQLTLTDDGRDELRRTRRALVAELLQRLSSWDDADVEALAHLLQRLSRGDGAASPATPPVVNPPHAASVPSTSDTGTPAETARPTNSAPHRPATPQIQENA